MNYEQIQKAIKHDGVVRYIAYLKKLSNAKDSKEWFPRFPEGRYIEVYNEVLSTGVWIDGETVTLQTRGGELLPNYNYQAYKNLVLARYPETLFDFQIVYKGDNFSFRKDSGKVTYSHVFGDPFGGSREVIGGYGIIKNSTGEFIELLTMGDIRKMRNTAKTQNIWELWFEEMVKKSIIKRICKVNFRDIIHEIDAIDNSNYEPDNANVEYSLQEDIDKCVKLSEITAIYNREKKVSPDQNKLIELCSRRKQEIEVTPEKPDWEEVKERIQAGALTEDIRREYYITDNNFEILLSECI